MTWPATGGSPGTLTKTSAMSAFSRKFNLLRWHDAVQEEGQTVMKQVTIGLYKGGNLRPDLFWQSLYPNDHTFGTHFTSCQQRVVKSYCPASNYSVQIAANDFDISLHWAIQKKLCGLKQTDLLYRKLNELVNIRNKDSHRTDHSGMSSSELRDHLEELLELCMSILTILEEYTDLLSVKQCIEQSINNRINDTMDRMDEYHHFGTDRFSTHATIRASGSKLKEDDNLGTLGKVAVGVVVAGVGVLALGALANRFMGAGDNRKLESKKNKTSNEECSVM